MAKRRGGGRRSSSRGRDGGRGRGRGGSSVRRRKSFGDRPQHAPGTINDRLDADSDRFRRGRGRGRRHPPGLQGREIGLYYSRLQTEKRKNGDDNGFQGRPFPLRRGGVMFVKSAEPYDSSRDTLLLAQRLAAKRERKIQSAGTTHTINEDIIKDIIEDLIQGVSNSIIQDTNDGNISGIDNRCSSDINSSGRTGTNDGNPERSVEIVQTEQLSMANSSSIAAMSVSQTELVQLNENLKEILVSSDENHSNKPSTSKLSDHSIIANPFAILGNSFSDEDEPAGANTSFEDEIVDVSDGAVVVTPNKTVVEDNDPTPAAAAAVAVAVAGPEMDQSLDENSSSTDESSFNSDDSDAVATMARFASRDLESGYRLTEDDEDDQIIAYLHHGLGYMSQDDDQTDDQDSSSDSDYLIDSDSGDQVDSENENDSDFQLDNDDNDVQLNNDVQPEGNERNDGYVLEEQPITIGNVTILPAGHRSNDSRQQRPGRKQRLVDNEMSDFTVYDYESDGDIHDLMNIRTCKKAKKACSNQAQSKNSSQSRQLRDGMFATLEEPDFERSIAQRVVEYRRNGQNEMTRMKMKKSGMDLPKHGARGAHGAMAFADSLREFCDAKNSELVLPNVHKKYKKKIRRLAREFGLGARTIGENRRQVTILYRLPDTSFPRKKHDRRKFCEKMFLYCNTTLAQEADFSAGGTRFGGVRAAMYREGQVVAANAPEIDNRNIGRVILERLGWEKGMTLGSPDARNGIHEPIAAIMKKSKLGVRIKGE